MKTLGTHLFVELSGCDRGKLNDSAYVRKTMEAAVKEAGATVLNGFDHQFVPQGVSCVLCLAESHISIHTWPESGYAAVDIFTCGDKAMPQKAVPVLVKSFGAAHYHVAQFSRGVPDDGGRHISVEVSRTQDAVVVGAPVLRKATARSH